MTAVTLQGDGDGVNDCEACGVWSDGHVYAEGAMHATQKRCCSWRYIEAPALLTTRYPCAHKCWACHKATALSALAQAARTACWRSPV
jgi:hypothetical protein